jgi:hypothetical protein
LKIGGAYFDEEEGTKSTFHVASQAELQLSPSEEAMPQEYGYIEGLQKYFFIRPQRCAESGLG